MLCHAVPWWTCSLRAFGFKLILRCIRWLLLEGFLPTSCTVTAICPYIAHAGAENRGMQVPCVCLCPMICMLMASILQTNSFDVDFSVQDVTIQKCMDAAVRMPLLSPVLFTHVHNVIRRHNYCHGWRRCWPKCAGTWENANPWVPFYSHGLRFAFQGQLHSCISSSCYWLTYRVRSS